MTSETDNIVIPIKTNKLKTFSTIGKTAIARLISDTLSIKTSIDKFNRLLVIGKSRDTDLEELLSYSLSPVPMSPGTTDGTPCKTVKAKRMHEFEKGVKHLAQVPVGSALIVDGKTFIHQIHTMTSTFGKLADRLLQDLMHMAIQCICLRVDFVCDQYPVHSIKNCERDRRAMGGTQVIHITRPDHKTPKQFKKYLANRRNKELLIEFLFQCWTRCDPGILGNVLLVVSHGDVCHSIVVNDAVVAVTEVPDLFSEHEEADTRLLLHAHQTDRVFSSLTIKSPDIIVLSLAKSQDFHGCLLLFMTEYGSNNRIINITELGIKLGQEKCQAIIGLHIFTGCDSISAFMGKGKRNPLGLMLESEAFCSTFIALRCGWEALDNIIPDVVHSVLIERFCWC